MKLMMCIKCQDVIKIATREMRSCICTQSSSRVLENGIDVETCGPCRVIGLHNMELADALILADRDDGMGRYFTAFVIARENPKIHKIS